MASLNLFSVSLQDPPDVFSAYWRALACGAGYKLTGELMTQLVTIAGGTVASRVLLPFPLPNACWVLVMADGGVIVLVNGTTQVQQHLFSALGAVLVTHVGQAGQVNSFFNSSALVIAAIIRPALAVLNPSKLFFMGHSLGGAVAQILAADDYPWPIRGVWTCGQPRAGNLAWCQNFPVPAERYTTPGDPVPMLPPSNNPLTDLTLVPTWPAFLPSYRHTGQRWHVQQNGVVYDYPEADSWTEGSTYLMTVLQGGTGWTGAHATTNYACRIRAGIPVAWKTASLDYPGIADMDAIAAELLGGPNATCPNELFTDTATNFGNGNLYAVQGVCR